jgi:hypothetical protein
MAATYTLASTTFATPVGVSDTQVKVASTSGLAAGMRLYADRELMQVVSLGVSSLVNVRRGVDGTTAQAHGTEVLVYMGTADQFFTHDPQGQPPFPLLVSPHINVSNGLVWFAQGDQLSPRYWMPQTVTHSVGPLGVVVTTYSPTSST